MRIGIDVGGTNTDAVPVDGTTVIGHVKHSTSKDITGGIGGALAALQQQYSFSPSAVQAVMIGTTHFLQRSHRATRTCTDSGSAIGASGDRRASADGAGWPRDLVSAVQELPRSRWARVRRSSYLAAWTPTRFAAMPPCAGSQRYSFGRNIFGVLSGQSRMRSGRRGDRA